MVSIFFKIVHQKFLRFLIKFRSICLQKFWKSYGQFFQDFPLKFWTCFKFFLKKSNIFGQISEHFMQSFWSFCGQFFGDFLSNFGKKIINFPRGGWGGERIAESMKISQNGSFCMFILLLRRLIFDNFPAVLRVSLYYD